MPHREIVDRVCMGNDCRDGTGYCLLSEILKYFGHEHEAEIPSGADCHERRNNCVLKDKIMETGLSDRMIAQLKCLEIFKYEECAARGNGTNMSWDEAFKLWRDRGYAEKFAEFYSLDKDPQETYREVVGRAA